MWQIKEGIFSWKQFLRQIYLNRKWKPRNQAQMETKGVWNICLEENFDVMWHDRKQNVNMMKVLSRKKISKLTNKAVDIFWSHVSCKFPMLHCVDAPLDQKPQQDLERKVGQDQVRFCSLIEVKWLAEDRYCWTETMTRAACKTAQCHHCWVIKSSKSNFWTKQKHLAKNWCSAGFTDQLTTQTLTVSNNQ